MRAFREVLDGLLGDAILKVGIYPTEGELLPCVAACLLEGIVMESIVVAVVVHDFDPVLGRILYKDVLGSKCFVRLVLELEVDKSEAAEVVDEDGSALVALLGEFAF